jgi:hypothetical protein
MENKMLSTKWKFILAFTVFILLLVGCSSRSSIVGRWDFSANNWGYEWIEFFDDGSYADSWGNPRTYSIPEEGTIQIRSSLDGFTFVWTYEVNGDVIEIIDDDEVVVGARVQ